MEMPEPDEEFEEASVLVEKLRRKKSPSELKRIGVAPVSHLDELNSELAMELLDNITPKNAPLHYSSPGVRRNYQTREQELLLYYISKLEEYKKSMGEELKEYSTLKSALKTCSYEKELVLGGN
jgi:hypothetical protein